MAAQKGSAFLLRVGDGGSPEVFTTVGGLRLTDFTLDTPAVEADNLTTGGWQTLLSQAGIRGITVTGSGIFTDSASEERVRNCAFNGSVANYELAFGSNDAFRGAFLITSYVREGNYDEEETYTLRLASAGPITYIAG